MISGVSVDFWTERFSLTSLQITAMPMQLRNYFKRKIVYKDERSLFYSFQPFLLPPFDSTGYTTYKW
jgi:valyl-tRNA synthetase